MCLGHEHIYATGGKGCVFKTRLPFPRAAAAVNSFRGHNPSTTQMTAEMRAVTPGPQTRLLFPNFPHIQGKITWKCVSRPAMVHVQHFACRGCVTGELNECTPYLKKRRKTRSQQTAMTRTINFPCPRKTSTSPSVMAALHRVSNRLQVRNTAQGWLIVMSSRPIVLRPLEVLGSRRRAQVAADRRGASLPWWSSTLDRLRRGSGVEVRIGLKKYRRTCPQKSFGRYR
ncbi:hypothetical protein HDK90DRAFT_292835 [Phyllosticta capitalensis]|uniref:Uncharacterized protein n=1 Tax=Phyllosticta capitalensis TaxID=121624 RepID=A0ABR1YJT8_9PEZI